MVPGQLHGNNRVIVATQSEGRVIERGREIGRGIEGRRGKGGEKE